ncbi:MAG: helix-turn-helix transcriptional regulator [Acidimicrobiales bacterium]
MSLPDNLAAEAEAARAADEADDAAGRASEDLPAGSGPGAEGQRPKVYGDSAYGSGEFQSLLEDAGIDSGCRTQPPAASGGRFATDRFGIDLEAGTVTCPAGVTVTLRRHRDASGTASFADACKTCPLAEPGVARSTVDHWRQRGLCPAPEWTAGGRPAWRWSSVAACAQSTGRSHRLRCGWRRRRAVTHPAPGLCSSRRRAVQSSRTPRYPNGSYAVGPCP